MTRTKRGFLAAAILALAVVTGMVVWRALSPPKGMSADVVGFLSSSAASEGYAKVVRPEPVAFPSAAGPHPDYQTEWWYYTGNLVAVEPGQAAVLAATPLTSTSGVSAPLLHVFDADPGKVTEAGYAAGRYGYQLTFFRRALAPPSQRSAGRQSAWATEQVYLGHFAVSDIRAGRHSSAERLARGAVGLAGAAADPFRVWLEGWAAEAATTAVAAASAPAGAGATRAGAVATRSTSAGSAGVAASDAEVADTSGAMPSADLGRAGSTTDSEDLGAWQSPVHLSAADGAVAIDLTLTPAKAPVLHGDAGYSRKGEAPGSASMYYSYTRLWSTGRITTAAGSALVAGWSWMDHEWSTSALSAKQTGWDWFALQLDDGRELMLFQLREKGGGISATSSGTLVEAELASANDHADAVQLLLTPLMKSGPTLATSTTPGESSSRSKRLARGDFVIEPDGHTWQSPVTGAKYPAGWRVTVPSEDLTLQVIPAIADQELDVAFKYWEGAVRVTGRRHGIEVGGVGYVELTGYALSGAAAGLPGLP